MLAEDTLIVSLSGFARHTQAPIVTLSSTPVRRIYRAKYVHIYAYTHP